MFIGIYNRSQVSVYRTIGPLVFLTTSLFRSFIKFLYRLDTNKCCLRCDARKPVFGVSDQVRQNRHVQSQNKARSLKFWINVEEELYYPCSENKGTDQLCSNISCAADLRLCFRLGKIRFSGVAAHLVYKMAVHRNAESCFA